MDMRLTVFGLEFMDRNNLQNPIAYSPKAIEDTTKIK
jgi:hypothetical protein